MPSESRTSAPARLVILGAGFAGLWAAVGAARKLDELGIGRDKVDVVLVNRTRFHSIRVRNYELRGDDHLVPLASVLDPIGVTLIEAEVTGVDPDRQTVRLGSRPDPLSYDRLIFALGGRMLDPGIAGLAEHGFDVDTFEHAAALDAHLTALEHGPDRPGRRTAIVLGAGLTGLEVATELAGRAGLDRVLLLDRADRVGSDLGDAARPTIEAALRSACIETRTGAELVVVDRDGATLRSGERIAAATVVACLGQRAHPATADFGVSLDPLGRLPVTECLQIEGRREFAAGDAATFLVDPPNACVMSCQHARPMGRFAGHNAVCDLLGLPMLPLRIDWYVTVVDLGAAGALYTEGWDRRVVATGETAKRTKQIINRERIYPPRSGLRDDILAAGAPTVQRPPTYGAVRP